MRRLVPSRHSTSMRGAQIITGSDLGRSSAPTSFAFHAWVQKGLSVMRSIVLFLASSILIPAPLAAGQALCLLATQIKIMTPLPVDHSAGLTVISNSNGGCVARSFDIPLRPVASRQTIAPLPAKKKLSTVAVAESLLARLGWANVGARAVSAVPTGEPRKYDRSREWSVAEGLDSGQTSFSTERAENAVVRF